MSQMRQMKVVYPQMMMGDGIISDLTDFNVPWRTSEYVDELDLGYYAHSGQKFVAPVIDDILGGDSNVLTELQRTKIAGMVYTIFNRKWTRLWNASRIEYNPISNYDMTETESIDSSRAELGTNTGTVNNANTGTITDSGTNGGTLTTVTDGETSNTGTSNHSESDGGTLTTVTDSDTTNTGTQSNIGSSDTDDTIFGFNSSVGVGSNSSANSNSSTRTDNLASTEDVTVTETRATTHTDLRTDNLASTEDVTVTETRNLTDSNTKTLNTTDLETRNLSTSNSSTNETDRTLTRSGNIGVTTTQQMLQSEVDLWQWTFFKQVFEDIDSVLCLDIY